MSVFETGVSTACMYPNPMKDTLKKLGENGVKGAELFVNTFSELSPESLREVKAVISAYNIKVPSLHPFTCAMEPMLFYSVYPGRLEDGLEMYKGFFEFAAQVEAEIFVLHGPKDVNAEISAEATYERYGRLYELGKRFGLKVAQENVSRTMAGSLDYLLGMKDYLKDDCGFVVDVKQARRGGLNPLEVISALGDKTLHIHYSETSSTSDCVTFGAGDMDREGLKRTLESAGFKGSIVLELYGMDGGGFPGLAASYSKMKNFFAEPLGCGQ